MAHAITPLFISFYLNRDGLPEQIHQSDANFFGGDSP